MAATAFERAKKTLGTRFRVRAHFWREWAKENPDGAAEAGIRAEECDANAEVVEALRPNYQAPDYPDMRAARAARKRARRDSE